MATSLLLGKLSKLPRLQLQIRFLSSAAECLARTEVLGRTWREEEHSDGKEQGHGRGLGGWSGEGVGRSPLGGRGKARDRKKADRWDHKPQSFTETLKTASAAPRSHVPAAKRGVPAGKRDEAMAPDGDKQWSMERLLEKNAQNVEAVRAAMAARSKESGQPASTAASLDDLLKFATQQGRPRLSGGADLVEEEVRMPTRWDVVSTMDACMPFFEGGLHKGHRWLMQHGRPPDERIATPTEWEDAAWMESAVAAGELKKRLSKAPSLAVMLDIMQAAVEAGCEPRWSYIDLIAKRCSRESSVQELWRLIRLNRQLGLPPSIVLYKRLVVATGKMRGLYSLRLILPAYLSEGLPLCRSILDALIGACGRSNSIEYAWGLVKVMEAAGLAPHINTMHALLNVYADARQPQEVERLFSKLQARGMQPTEVSWAILAKAWSRVGDPSKVQAVLMESRRAGHRVSLAAWASAAAAHASVGDSAAISGILEEVEAGRLGQERTAREDACFVAGIYTSLITCHVQAGDLEEAEAGLRRAQQHGVPASNAMHASIMFGYKEAGDFESCLRMWEEAVAQGIDMGRQGKMLLVEAAMQAWSSQGRPVEMLQKADELFKLARDHHWRSHMATTSKAPQGSQLDLHTFGPWSAQFMILDYLQTTATKLAGGWRFPDADPTFVTGWGMHSKGKMAQPAIIRDVTLRFLQGMFSPRLATKNEGIVVVRRLEFLSFLRSARQQGLRLEPLSLADSFLEARSNTEGASGLQTPVWQ